MSIITQALKKAQHEQRVQQPRRARYGSLASVRLNEPRRRPSRLVAVGGVLLLGAGIAAYLWPSMRGAAPIAMTVPSNPPAAPDIQIALPPSAPVSNPQARSPQTPDPWVLKLLQPGAQPRTTPPPINTANLETPRTVPPPQVRPVQPRRTPPPNPPVAATPALSRKAQLARAQQHFDRGLEAYDAGLLDKAESLLQQAITFDPTLKRAFNSLGNLYYQREAYEQAKAMYEKALALDPDYIKARNNLGNTYMQLDMSFKAITELTKAILADSESGLAYYNMACVYARTSEPEKAIRYLEMAIVRDPEARHWAKTDDDFSAVRSKSEFQKLLGTSS